MKEFLSALLCVGLCVPAALAADFDVGKLKITGEIEVQGYYERHGMQEGKGAEKAESKIVVPTVAINLEAPLAENLQGYISLLWDETSEDEGVVVDVATITWTSAPYRLTAGKMYVPFGDYTTAFVSDPLTLTLGQTRETAVLATVDPVESVTFGVYGFNGEAEKADDGERPDKHNQWDFGAVLVVRPFDGVSFGGGYIGDLAESEYHLVKDDLYSKRVAGASAFANFCHGPFRAGAEVVAALSDFEGADVEGADRDVRPLAWHVEAAYDVAKDFVLALGFDGTREWVDVPMFRLGAVAAWRATETGILSLEYLNGVYDSNYSDQHRVERITVDFDITF